ncbi:MAG: MerR family transcriptional regulator [Myxococcota bacterium]
MSWQTESEQELLTIAQVREISGVSARTLRYYEELELLPGIRRRAGGRRVYGRDEIERLRFIQRLKALGLSLAEIKQLNAVYQIQGSTQAMLSHLEKLLDDQLEVVDGRISELVALRDDIQKYGDHVVSRLRQTRKGLRLDRRSAQDPDQHPEDREEDA